MASGAPVLNRVKKGQGICPRFGLPVIAAMLHLPLYRSRITCVANNAFVFEELQCECLSAVAVLGPYQSLAALQRTLKNRPPLGLALGVPACRRENL